MQNDLVCFSVFPGKEVGQGEKMAVAGLPSIHNSHGFFNEQAGVLVHFTNDKRIARTIPLRIFGIDVSHPEEFTGRMMDELGAGTGGKEGVPIGIRPGFCRGPGPAIIC